ncbi:MAG TPA: hypothetical protein DER07_02040 [Armatimonadetes bacterium]|nr:hypothetical protein [Armatimonadota bacterium]
MGRTKRADGGSRLYLAIIVVGLAVLAAIAAYVQLAPATKVPEAIRRTESSGQATQPPKEVRVLTPRYEDGNLRFESKPIRPERGEDPMLAAINGFLAEAKVAPPEAKCRSARREGDLVVLDFSAAFGQTYGAEDEQTLLGGIAKTLAQFPGVKRFRITVEGRPIETLGNIELTDPLAISDF